MDIPENFTLTGAYLITYSAMIIGKFFTKWHATEVIGQTSTGDIHGHLLNPKVTFIFSEVDDLSFFMDH